MMLGEQTFTVTSKAAGSWVLGDWVDGPATSRTFKGVLQPMTSRQLQQLPEQWRTRGGWKLYTQERLKTVDVYGETAADTVTWPDPAIGSLGLLVASTTDYSNTPLGMSLKHFKYTLIEQEVSDVAR